jgi:hypothetical protein
MLKSTRVELTGKDAGRVIELTELPALIADRCARAALTAIGAPIEGGVVTLALKHTDDVRKLGEKGALLLQPFVDGVLASGERLDVARDLRDWRNISRLQQSALLLHVGFMFGRETVDIPVAMQAAAIVSGNADTRAAFCSPHIAAVLHSKQATYRELETVLSTEDVFNLVELVNVESIHAWRAQQATKEP